MTDTSLNALISWLQDEGRLKPSINEMTVELAERIVDAGVPLWRFRIGMRTLHPMITALSAMWEREGGFVETPQAAHGLETRASYIGSPLEVIAQTGRPVRYKLTEPLSPDSHTVLHELKARGATDYFGLPLVFTTQPGGLAVFVSDAPEGFTGVEIDLLTRLSAALAPMLEVYRLKHSASAITQAYLGPRTAERVLSGQITRGHVDTIRAVILVSDIRGWTAINTRHPPTETVALANRYFDILGDAIETRGGEILKLMGDGLLAIFTGEDETRACRSALEAARAAQSAARQDPALGAEFGVALHVGDVLYGNIGSDTRLDFTVLGAAVNLAARLEGMCAKYQRGVLFSRAFADQIGEEAVLLGREALKGLDAPQEIYALRRD